MIKMYIAILDEFPDYMAPTLVAHTILNAHEEFFCNPTYSKWFHNSFRKVVVRVNQKEFDKISELSFDSGVSRVFLGHENTTLNAKKSCAVVCPYDDNEDLPNVLKYAKLWKPKYDQ